MTDTAGAARMDATVEDTNHPSFVVAVIVAVPTFTPVTTPRELTVATAVLLLFQTTEGFVAFAGKTEQSICADCPTTIDGLVVFIVREDADIQFFTCVVNSNPFKLPSPVVLSYPIVAE